MDNEDNDWIYVAQFLVCKHEFDKGGKFFDQPSDTRHSQEELLVHAVSSV
jgi:hypothetical protein